MKIPSPKYNRDLGGSCPFHCELETPCARRISVIASPNTAKRDGDPSHPIDMGRYINATSSSPSTPKNFPGSSVNISKHNAGRKRCSMEEDAISRLVSAIGVAGCLAFNCIISCAISANVGTVTL